MPLSSRSSGIPVFKKAQRDNNPSNTNAGRNFAAKAARAGLGIVSSGRTPWKGASGRSTPMSPIADNPNSGSSLVDSSFDQNSSATRYLTVRNGKVSPADGDDDTQSPSPQFTDSEDDVKPPVPLKASGRNRSSQSIPKVSPQPTGHNQNMPSIDLKERLGTGDTLEQDTTGSLSAQLRVSQDPKSRFSWTTRAAESGAPTTPPSGAAKATNSAKGLLERPQLRSHFSWTSRVTDDTSQGRSPASPTDALEQSSPADAGKEEQHVPGSRFSWSTQNTLVTQQNAAAPEHLNTPQNPNLFSAAPSPHSPIISRRRPIPGPNSGNTIKRKPAPSETGEIASPAGTPGKELPLSPPAMESIDIITGLQAQIDELEHRRMNLQKVIHSLAALQPQNPVVQDLAKRRETRRKIERLETEVADVRSQQHQLGLRLHRALKKRDQEAPTGLWVRRVTS